MVVSGVRSARGVSCDVVCRMLSRRARASCVCRVESSGAGEPVMYARDPNSSCSAKSWRAAVLAEFVLDHLQPSQPGISPFPGLILADG